jgi:hypothetical protein
MPNYFPLLKDPSSSGFYAVGDTDMVSQSPNLGQHTYASRAETVELGFPAILRNININSVSRDLDTTHTKLIAGAFSIFGW